MPEFMATDRARRNHPQSPSAAVARLMLNAEDRITSDRELLDCALAFASEIPGPAERSDVTTRRAELRSCLDQYRQDPAALYDRLKGDLRADLDKVRIVPEWWFGEIDGHRSVRRFDEVVPSSWRS